jgi:ribonuclease-3
MDYNYLEEVIGYTFNNKDLLVMALTHSSYANERAVKSECNERLEYLGDAVLELVVSECIYKTHYNMPEGEMTKLRASIVCEESLSYHAKQLNLGDYLLLGKGEESAGGRRRNSILADVFESVLGAVFLDAGFDAAREYLLNLMSEAVTDDRAEKKIDFKTELQERVQRNSKEPPVYEITGETGPDHEKEFYAIVSHAGKEIGSGKGRTKKEAEQEAAKMALKII